MSSELFEPIAVVGMACRYPGSPDIDSYWENIKANKVFIETLTDRETGIPQIYDADPGAWNKTNCRMGSRLEVADIPCGEIAGLSQQVLESIEPINRAIIKTAEEAMSSCTVDRKKTYVAISGRELNTQIPEINFGGIYARANKIRATEIFGSLSPEMQGEVLHHIENDFFKPNQPLDRASHYYMKKGVFVRLIAESLGLHGGSTVVDSACASSFTALEIAMNRLRLKQSDAALVGGIGRILSLMYLFCGKAGTMSPHGCFPFDERASGFVSGEGMGFVTLKRLSDAIQDADEIHAVLRGIGASSDGAKTGPWAPCKEGQKLAVKRALGQVDYGIEDVQYIECHGTGTQVGDLEELTGISELTEDVSHPIRIGSSKGAIGHLLRGAGMAGLLRTILAMKAETFPRTGGFRKLNPMLRLDQWGFTIPHTNEPWKKRSSQPVRRAMVNCFGFGGNNYNLQLEEYDAIYHRELLESIVGLDDKREESISIIGFATRLAKSNLQKLNLKRHDSFICLKPGTKWSVPVSNAGYVPLPQMKDCYKWKIPPTTIANLDPNQFRLLSVVEASIENAKLHLDGKTVQRSALICGMTNDSEFFTKVFSSVALLEFVDWIKHDLSILEPEERVLLAEQFQQAVKKDFVEIKGDHSVSGVDSMLSARAAKLLDFRGGAYCHDSRDDSFRACMESAINSLRVGSIDTAVVCSSTTSLSGLSFVEDLLFQEQVRILGEGAVSFVLKRSKDAAEAAIADITGFSDVPSSGNNPVDVETGHLRVTQDFVHLAKAIESPTQQNVPITSGILKIEPAQKERPQTERARKKNARNEEASNEPSREVNEPVLIAGLPSKKYATIVNAFGPLPDLERHDSLPADVEQRFRIAIDNLKQFTPDDYLDELHLLARQYNVDDERIYIANTLSCLSYSELGGCLGVTKTSTEGFAHAANFDITLFNSANTPKFLPLQFGLPGTDERHYSFVGLFAVGSLFPTCGQNEHGLSISMATSSNSKVSERGMNFLVFIRYALETCKCLDELSQLVMNTTFESAFILLASQNGKAIKYEICSNKKFLMTGDTLCHTNHFTDIDDGFQPHADSKVRLARLEELARSLEPRDFVKILGDQFDLTKNKTAKFATANTLNRYNTCLSVRFCSDGFFVAKDKIPSGNLEYQHISFQKRVKQEGGGPQRISKTSRQVPVVGRELMWKDVEAVSLPIAVVHQNEPGADRVIDEMQLRYTAAGYFDLFDMEVSDYCLLDISGYYLQKPLMELSSSDLTWRYHRLRELFERRGFPKKIISVSQSGPMANDGALISQMNHAFYGSLAKDYPAIQCMRVNCEPGLDAQALTKLATRLFGQDDFYGQEVHILGSRIFLAEYQEQYVSSVRPLERQSYIVTGGAAGITAKLLIDLAKKGKVEELVLIGRSKIEAEEWDELGQSAFLSAYREKNPDLLPKQLMAAWKRLQRKKETLATIRLLRNLGCQMSYYSIDLNGSRLEPELAEVFERHPNVNHLIHGAGLDMSKKFMQKDLAIFDTIIGVKTLSTFRMLKSKRGGDFDSVMLFSSVSAIKGNVGQTDYAAANRAAMVLPALLRRRYPNTRFSTIAWPAWDEVGMAMDEAVHKEMVESGVEFLPVSSGCEFFESELQANLAISNVVCSTEVQPQNKEFAEKVSCLGYLDQVILHNPKSLLVSAVFSREQDFIEQHKIGGKCAIAGVVLTETVLQVASLLGDYGIQLIQFQKPLTVERTVSLQISIDKESLQFEIWAPISKPGGRILNPRSVFVSGQLEPKQNITACWKLPSKEVCTNKEEFYRWFTGAIADEFGQVYQNIEKVFQFDRDEISAEVFLPIEHGFGEGRLLANGGLFDSMNQLIAKYTMQFSYMFVPQKFEGVAVTRPIQPGQRYFVSIDRFKIDGVSCTYRARYFDRNGDLCLQVQKVTLTKIREHKGKLE